MLREHPAFIRYWLASASSSFGFQMLSVAVGWQVYSISGSALDLGLIGLVQFIPSVLLALPAGHAADRRERRRIVLAGQIAVFMAIAVLAALTVIGSNNKFEILALVALIGVAKAFEFPALQSMLPALVPAEILPRALAVNASAEQAAMILGPALGGLLYLGGPGAVYLLGSLLHLLAAILMLRLRSERAQPPGESETLKSVFAGLHFIRRNPDVLGVISLDLFAVLFGGAAALLPIFARDILHTGPWGLGLLRAAPAVGALMMSFWLARHSLERRVGLTMFGAVMGFGLATMVFALSRLLWLSLMSLLVLGAFDMISMVIRGAMVQMDTPDEMRGRVNGVNAVFINTSWQLGEFESGFLAAMLGAVPATAIGGLGTMLVVVLWMIMFPTLRRRQKLNQVQPALSGPIPR
jgi:MFS family permease